MKNKSLISIIVAIILVLGGWLLVSQQKEINITTERVAVKPVGQQILATGMIRSQNEATLSFQTGGKLIYLPFKEGDSVKQGQVIAQLDSRAIQNALQSAVDASQNQKIQFDITNDFNGDRALSDTGLSTSALRQLQTATNTLNQAQLAVAVQQIALEQSTLTSPIDGVITHEDVTTPNVNITPATTFTIADPQEMVFRANISENDISFIALGAPVTITLDGLPNKKIQGVVSKIYQQKQTLASGENIYQVDIQADNLNTIGALRQSGSVVISSKFSGQHVMLIPSWVVLGNKYVWVMRSDKAILQEVTVGDLVGNDIEVTSGLQDNDVIIVAPKAFVTKKYIVL